MKLLCHSVRHRLNHGPITDVWMLRRPSVAYGSRRNDVTAAYAAYTRPYSMQAYMSGPQALHHQIMLTASDGSMFHTPHFEHITAELPD